MNIYHIFKKIICHRKSLSYCVEAFYYLSTSKVLVKFVSFIQYANKFGIRHCETLLERNPNPDELKSIILALKIVCKILPWNTQCLDQAMAAQRMLKRRRHQYTIYFGLKRDKNGLLIGHVWIRCGNVWIVGYKKNINYVIVGTYAFY